MTTALVGGGEGGCDATADLLTSNSFLLVAAAPSLHGSGALRAEPFALGGLGQTHTAVVEPLNGTLKQRDGNTGKHHSDQLHVFLNYMFFFFFILTTFKIVDI